MSLSLLPVYAVSMSPPETVLKGESITQALYHESCTLSEFPVSTHVSATLEAQRRKWPRPDLLCFTSAPASSVLTALMAVSLPYVLPGLLLLWPICLRDLPLWGR